MGEIQRDPALISIPKVKRLNISLFTLFYFAFLPLYLLSHPSSPLSLPLRALIHLPPMLFQCSIFIKLQLGTLTKSRGCHSPPPRYDISSEAPDEFQYRLEEIYEPSIKQTHPTLTYLKRPVCESYLASGTYYI